MPLRENCPINADIIALRRTVVIVAALNLGYFGIEFVVATHIGSVALFADSIDFLEDASVNALIWLGLEWSARNRAKLGMVLAAVLLIPAVATLWTAWQHVGSGRIPAPIPLTATGTGALIVNLSCALMLAKVRHVQGSLTKAAFLSARNDTIANVAIIVAGMVTALKPSAWPDLMVGLGILVMNLDAAREIFQTAREERRHS
ncbi:MAG: cation transporter [Steroidobacteraceae bacterium]